MYIILVYNNTVVSNDGASEYSEQLAMVEQRSLEDIDAECQLLRSLETQQAEAAFFVRQRIFYLEQYVEIIKAKEADGQMRENFKTMPFSYIAVRAISKMIEAEKCINDERGADTIEKHWSLR